MNDRLAIKYFLVPASMALFLAGCNAPAPSGATQGSQPATNTAVNEPLAEEPVPVTSTPTRRPSSTIVVNAHAEIVGEEEKVYNYVTDRCADGMVPDLPVRAFRDADGKVQLNLSGPTNYRMIGPDLDSLQVDCSPTMKSDFDPDPSQYGFSEWMGSTYTLDGETVYALIHNEFYGDQASAWDARRDFASTQDRNDWTYQSWNGSKYRNMNYDGLNHRWQGSQPLCQLGKWGAHPDQFCDPTRTWISPVTDTVTISGGAWDADPGGGNGVIISVLKGDEELWSATIENGDQEGSDFSLEVPVLEGEAIHLRVNSRGDAGYDSTGYAFEINVGPDPCDPGKLCHYFSITYAVSTDGGKTFTQPPAPDRLVATLPYPYEPNMGLIANWQPSNIVKSPKDDYYYALLQIDTIRLGGAIAFQGTCVMRTETLDDPQSWRAWDGEGFNMRFINPYLEPDADPEEHTCESVPVSAHGALSYYLTYNTYFDKFMAAGHAVNAPVPGFYYSLSDDLVHWTPAKLLMATNLMQNAGGPYLAYPSLIDPDDESRNFDRTGQRPYLYYSRFQRPALEDIDLLRVRVQFEEK